MDGRSKIQKPTPSAYFRWTIHCGMCAKSELKVIAKFHLDNGSWMGLNRDPKETVAHIQSGNSLRRDAEKVSEQTSSARPIACGRVFKRGSCQFQHNPYVDCC